MICLAVKGWVGPDQTRRGGRHWQRRQHRSGVKYIWELPIPWTLYDSSVHLLEEICNCIGHICFRRYLVILIESLVTWRDSSINSWTHRLEWRYPFISYVGQQVICSDQPMCVDPGDTKTSWNHFFIVIVLNFPGEPDPAKWGPNSFDQKVDQENWRLQLQ